MLPDGRPNGFPSLIDLRPVPPPSRQPRGGNLSRKGNRAGDGTPWGSELAPLGHHEPTPRRQPGRMGTQLGRTLYAVELDLSGPARSTRNAMDSRHPAQD